MENEATGESIAARTANPPARGTCLPWVLILLTLYAAGLTREISEPWVGVHDWNGAFFSQLARNLLRYPWELHHAMPIVAVGAETPLPEERSIYATHPAGLVWLVAFFFKIFGEAEWAARLPAVLASLGTLGLLVWLVRRAWGQEMAVPAGLIYSVMPMAVYFGRMVDHEAICLFFMLAAIAAWQVKAGDRATGWKPVPQGIAGAAWAGCLFGMVWVDWSGVLFAGLFCLHALIQWRRRQLSGRLIAYVVGVSAAACLTMLLHLVYAGLEGRWSDLVAIFLSRAAQEESVPLRKDQAAPGGPWEYAVANLTWPGLMLAALGVLVYVTQRRRLSGGTTVPQAIAPGSDTGWKPAPQGLDVADVYWVLPATGVIWLAVFWQQFLRHNYWLFYLGPTAAVAAAYALLEIRNRMLPWGTRRANAVMYALLGLTIAVALRGTDDYFNRISYPPQAVAALQQINRATKPQDRLLLYRDPALVEQRGGYRFRNLVPPHESYYLDRTFDVERDPQAVLQRASRYAAFVVPMQDVLKAGGAFGPLEQRFRGLPLGLWVVFDLHAPAGPPPTSSLADSP